MIDEPTEPAAPVIPEVVVPAGAPDPDAPTNKVEAAANAADAQTESPFQAAPADTGAAIAPAGPSATLEPVVEPASAPAETPAVPAHSIHIDKSILDEGALFLPKGATLQSVETSADGIVLKVEGIAGPLVVKLRDEWDEHYGTRRIIDWIGVEG